MKVKLTILLLSVFVAAVFRVYGDDPLSRARIWCDSVPLSALEGIWLLPDDKVYVLSKRTSSDAMADCSLTVVASLDGITPAGTDLGTLSPMADRNKVALTLPTSKGRDRMPSGMKSCVMTVSDGGYALVVDAASRQFRLQISPTMLLPGFWRMVRFSFTPGQQKQYPGMVKVYPSYDGNGSDRHNPRYM